MTQCRYGLNFNLLYGTWYILNCGTNIGQIYNNRYNIVIRDQRMKVNIVNSL